MLLHFCIVFIPFLSSGFLFLTKIIRDVFAVVVVVVVMLRLADDDDDGANDGVAGDDDDVN